MSESVPLLDVRGLRTEFRSGGNVFAAVDGVSFALAPGETLGIVGESGCGKSVTSLSIMRLVPDPPGRIAAGEVLLRGAPIAGQKRRELARTIQMVFQDPYSALNPRRTVDAIVGQPLRIHGVGESSERARRVRELLDLVGLPVRMADSYPAQLSGGQRQRVVIARALALQPRIIICDEPTSALDVSVQSQILNLLLDLRRELGLSYVFVSHNLAVVEHVATRIAVMYLGRFVEIGGAEEVFRRPGHPYTRVLLKSVLTPAPRAGVPDIRLRGGAPNPAEMPTGCRFHPRCPEVLPICATQDPPPIDVDGKRVACHLAKAS